MLWSLSTTSQRVFGGVGERTREGNDLYTEMVDSKVIVPESLPDSKVSLIYGQMNEPPGARMRVGLSALTVAEYFREDLQLFIDNIFRFVQAGQVLYGRWLCYWLPRSYAVVSLLSFVCLFHEQSISIVQLCYGSKCVYPSPVSVAVCTWAIESIVWAHEHIHRSSYILSRTSRRWAKLAP